LLSYLYLHYNVSVWIHNNKSNVSIRHHQEVVAITVVVVVVDEAVPMVVDTAAMVVVVVVVDVEDRMVPRRRRLLVAWVAAVLVPDHPRHLVVPDLEVWVVGWEEEEEEADPWVVLPQPVVSSAVVAAETVVAIPARTVPK
jgi:hypothetical protein